MGLSCIRGAPERVYILGVIRVGYDTLFPNTSEVGDSF